MNTLAIEVLKKHWEARMHNDFKKSTIAVNYLKIIIPAMEEFALNENLKLKDELEAVALRDKLNFEAAELLKH